MASKLLTITHYSVWPPCAGHRPAARLRLLRGMAGIFSRKIRDSTSARTLPTEAGEE